MLNDIYNNLNHILNKDRVKYISNNPGQEAIHYAWDFMGYISYDPKSKLFSERVFRYGKKVGAYSNESIEELIKEVNSKYGNE